jgi:hypothetical protein
LICEAVGVLRVNQLEVCVGARENKGLGWLYERGPSPQSSDGRAKNVEHPILCADLAPSQRNADVMTQERLNHSGIPETSQDESVQAQQPGSPSLSEIDLAKLLQHLRVLTQPWTGEPLDDEGTMRLVNADGRRPPLYWVFNAANEPQNLINVLDADQPVVSMRSLNKIATREAREGGPALDQLADHFASTLLNRFGTRACILGGNCNAAEVAYRVAERLSLAGVNIIRFVTLDKSLHLPLPLPARMIFGETRGHGNPADLAEDARARTRAYWHNLFPSFDVDEIASKHGHFFGPDKVTLLANAIFKPSPTLPTLQWTGSIDWQHSVCSDGRLRLELPTHFPSVDPEQLDVVPMFARDGGTRFLFRDMAQLASPAVVENGRIVFYICPLEQGGEWTLRPILCQRGKGPVTWPIERQDALSLLVRLVFSVSALQNSKV